MRFIRFKKTLGSLLSIFIALSISNAVAKDEHEHHKMHDDASAQISLVGEVLDLYCFMKHPENGQGQDHATCAKNCIGKGLPIGFMSDGEVYLLLGKNHESVKDLAADFAGVQARLTGFLVEHDGVKAIDVESIEAISGHEQ